VIELCANFGQFVGGIVFSGLCANCDRVIGGTVLLSCVPTVTGL
jgi:hypothetical protein